MRNVHSLATTDTPSLDEIGAMSSEAGACVGDERICRSKWLCEINGDSLLIVRESPGMGKMILAPVLVQWLLRTKDGRSEPSVMRP